LTGRPADDIHPTGTLPITDPAFGGAVTLAGGPQARQSGQGRGRPPYLASANDVDTKIWTRQSHGWYDELVMFAIFSSLCQYKSGDTWTWQLDAAERLVEVGPTAIEFRLKRGFDGRMDLLADSGGL